MAYFDDPQKLESWQRELDELREQRGRGAAAPQDAPDREEQIEASGALSWSPGRGDVLREPITLEELELDAGVQKPQVLQAPVRQRSKRDPQIQR